MGTATVEARASGSNETPFRDAKLMAPESDNPKVRSKLVRRGDRDYSQRLRFVIQATFFALNLWIGFQFYLWVRWAETGGQMPAFSRPAGVEGWLPIEGMMQFKYVLLSGHLPRLHPAAFFLFTKSRLTRLRGKQFEARLRTSEPKDC